MQVSDPYLTSVYLYSFINLDGCSVILVLCHSSVKTASIMNTAASQIQPRGHKRTVQFKVLCLGMSRSGTESLCKALEILQIPCYHGWRSMENHHQSILWAEAIEAKYENKGELWKREDL